MDKLDLVVIGLGYVGLPLAREAVLSRMRVAGLDVDANVVARLTSGRSHVDDLSDADVRRMLDGGFIATSDPSVIARSSAIVICVPTPLSREGGPDLTAVRSAAESVGANVTKGTLVVLESTSYPGTTAEFLKPILEEASRLVAGVDLFVAYSPERIDPGNQTFTLRTTPKIVGADDVEALDRATALYSRLCDRVVVAKGTREAESAKLLENTYRHVNIALVNEMCQFFHEMRIDFWDVLSLAASKPFGFQSFRPGPGVGGHCIPIDPNYLGHQVRSQLGYPFKFVELAQEINAAMPVYVARRVFGMLNSAGLPVEGARALLLGIAYKPDIADDRETPARDVARELLARGVHVSFHDPFVESWGMLGVERLSGDPEQFAPEFDVVILLQNHSCYEPDAIAHRSKLFLDTRGVTASPVAERL